MTEWTLERLLGEVVGSGPKSAEDMTRGQARAAFDQILERSADPTTLGAFLLANRWKRNTPEELAAFLDVMIERSVDRAPADRPVVDCGANYDGKDRTALLGVGAGLIAAAVGVPVVVHSGDRVPVQAGCAYKHVLDELGVPTELTPAESGRMVNETGFGYYYQPAFNPEIDALEDRRRQVAVRTMINTIETLANPADASVHLGSFYHLSFGKKLVETLERSEAAGFDRAVFVQGLEGYDDVRPGLTKVAEWTGDGLDTKEIDPSAFEMSFTREDLEVEDVSTASARLTREVLTGERHGQIAEAMILNAALRLYAGGAVADIGGGVELARDAVADGRAAERLELLRNERVDVPA